MGKPKRENEDRLTGVHHDDKVIKKSKKIRTKQLLAEAQEELSSLKEQLAHEQAWHSRYHDALEEAGLICGVCLEEPVLEASLKCCSNKLCPKCEDQIAEKHAACPFCRAFLTTPKQQAKAQQLAQQKQEQERQRQLQQQQADSSRAAAWRLLTAGRQQSGGYEGDWDGASDYDDSDDYNSSEEEQAEPPVDTTVLLAAAAEAAAAALAGPKGTCGLCGSTWLMSGLASAPALPGLLLCRTCWRNIPDLSGQPFPAGGAPGSVTGADAARTGAGSMNFRSSSATGATVAAVAAADPDPARADRSAVGPSSTAPSARRNARDFLAALAGRMAGAEAAALRPSGQTAGRAAAAAKAAAAPPKAAAPAAAAAAAAGPSSGGKKEGSRQFKGIPAGAAKLAAAVQGCSKKRKQSGNEAAAVARGGSPSAGTRSHDSAVAAAAATSARLHKGGSTSGSSSKKVKLSSSSSHKASSSKPERTIKPLSIAKPKKKAASSSYAR